MIPTPFGMLGFAELSTPQRFIEERKAVYNENVLVVLPLNLRETPKQKHLQEQGNPKLTPMVYYSIYMSTFVKLKQIQLLGWVLVELVIAYAPTHGCPFL